jgi:hypothetical protein
MCRRKAEMLEQPSLKRYPTLCGQQHLVSVGDCWSDWREKSQLFEDRSHF